VSNKDQALMLLCFTVLALGLAAIFQTQLTNREIAYENQTYLKANACIISVSPTTRTPEYVKGCYDQAEKEMHVTIQRYGNAK
jgi:hypothetical protein